MAIEIRPLKEEDLNELILQLKTIDQKDKNIKKLIQNLEELKKDSEDTY